MAGPTPRELRRRLRRLDDDELARFVAALWAATGWSTAVRDGRVVARRHDPATERLDVAVVGGTVGVARTLARTPADADVLVTPVGERAARLLATRADLEVVDAADLHERLTYAVEPAAREHLLAEHLGAAPRGPTRRTVLSAVAVGAVAVGGGALASFGRSEGPMSAGLLRDSDGPTPDTTGAGDDAERTSRTSPGEDTPTQAADTTVPRGTPAPTPTTSVGCGVGPRQAILEQVAAFRRLLSVQSGTIPEIDRPIGYDFDEPGERFVTAVNEVGEGPFRRAASVTVGRALVQGTLALVPVTVVTDDGETVRYKFTITQTPEECWRTLDAERTTLSDEEG